MIKIDSNNKNTASGFTLLEMMVALLLVSVLGLLTSSIINTSIRTKTGLENAGEMDKIIDALNLISQDLRYTVVKKTRDSTGMIQPHVFSGKTENNTATLSFTTISPVQSSASPHMVLPVTYTLEKNTLKRYSTAVINMAFTDRPSQILLKNVKSLSVDFIHQSNTYTYWPVTDITRPALPQALKIKLHHKTFGVFEKWVLLNQNGGIQ